jgi:hypothetical protein
VILTGKDLEKEDMILHGFQDSKTAISTLNTLNFQLNSMKNAMKMQVQRERKDQMVHTIMTPISLLEQ